MSAAGQRSTLSNGIRVVSVAMAHVETVALGVWIKCGARHEPAHLNGMSHLLEHMAFKGTTTRSAREIAETIEQVGGELNAATSLEMTAYYARVLKADTGLALTLLADILRHAVHDEEELALERDVILQEIAATRDVPDEIAFDLLQEASFPDQAIGRPVLGTPQTIGAFARSDVQAFQQREYRPERIVISAAGAIDHDALVKQAEALFGDWPEGDAADAQARDTTPPRFQGGAVSSTRPFEQAHLLMACEGRPVLHKDFYAALIFANLFGGGMSSRLFQEVREKRGLCYSIYASHWGLADTGMMTIHAACAAASLDPLAEVIVTEWRDLAREGPKARELERSKAQFKAGLMMGLESCAARAEQMARQTMILDRLVGSEELIGKIDAVRANDVRDVAAHLLDTAPATVTVVGAGEASAEHARSAYARLGGGGVGSGL
ncbi:MAG: pitrilysin family protein [Pseudomonadota bacterium]